MLRRSGSFLSFAVLLVSLGGLAPGARAHPLAPALLSLDAEADEGTEAAASEGRVYQVTWKMPLRLPPGVRLEPLLPEVCEPVGAAEQGQEGTAWIARFQLSCSGASLAGQEIGVLGLPARGAGAVVRVALPGAPAFQQVVTATAPMVTIPERVSRLAVFRDYAELGTHHLVFGFDHVLFVLGLLLLVRGSRPLLYTITAFTVGHSVTLALSVLEIARVNSAWVEVGIALTLVATALEIVPRARRRSLFGRAPWRVAFAFGLLHGLGFAGALAEIGLPAGEIPLALLAFNIGIEVGQLAIVAVALLLAAAITRLFASGETSALTQDPRLRWAAAYGLGGLSAYWLFERLGGALLA